jgi:hypothetical protein
MDMEEIRKMFELMDKFVNENPLNIVSEEEISMEESTHITKSHKAMNKNKKLFGLECFVFAK